MDGYTEARFICHILTEAGYPTMLAGGCVRDRLFGLPPSDYDLATAAWPEEGMAFFRQRGYTVVPVGLAHGTFALVTSLQRLEITTLRVDVSCFGRRAEVAFTEDFCLDAQRRDFTINALYEDAGGKVHDFVGGLADMKARLLRFVGDPEARIREDYLRGLRYFRFLARLGWPAHSGQFKAIAGNLEGMKLLSAERVQNEMEKLLGAPHFPAILPIMSETGTLSVLLPGFAPQRMSLLRKILCDFQARSTLLLWFSLLYWGSPSPPKVSDLKARLARARFTRKQHRALLALTDLFQHFDQPYPSLVRLLRIHEGNNADPRELMGYFECLQRMSVLDFPPHLLSLARGLIARERPVLPEPEILRIPPVRRAHAVDLAKIYWYLGLYRATNQLISVMHRADHFRKKLEAPAKNGNGPRPRGH